MVLYSYMILLLLLLKVFLSLGALDMTVVNEHCIVRDNDISYLKCISDDPGLSAEPFKRVMDTGSGSHMTSMILVGPISPEVWPGRRLSMFAEGGLKRTGVFSCTLEGDKGNDEVVQAIKIGTSGGVWPESFTLTANKDENINLKFLSHDHMDNLIWRHQGVIMSHVSSLTHNIPRVSSEHAGIYECYKYPTHTDEISTYRPQDQAIMRLIVRECPDGKWKPPHCGRTCQCMNGGACDHNTGQCVCPPGFKGEHCDEACGGNRFGGSCQFACKEGGSSYGEDAEECRLRQFCLPDPYGCSCATGFQGLECNEGCPLGSYGAGCKQECNCKRPDLCNRFTGSCTMGCKAGWRGPSCQEACEDGTWGDGCKQICHCLDNVHCDIYTGKCPNDECAEPFTGISCQTDAVDECMSSPCQQESTCIDKISSYECACPNGTEGINCENDLDDCESNPCLHGATCKDTGRLQFECTCQIGFTGMMCEIDVDDCSPHQCKNGAACVDLVDDFSCSCKTGYVGNLCEDICQPGTFHDTDAGICVLCDPKSYQENAGKAFCVPCPTGTVSKKNGTTSIDDCVVNNVLNVNASVDSLIFIIVGLLGSVLLIALGVLLWYYGWHKKKNRLQRVTIRRAW